MPLHTLHGTPGCGAHPTLVGTTSRAFRFRTCPNGLLHPGRPPHENTKTRAVPLDLNRLNMDGADSAQACHLTGSLGFLRPRLLSWSGCSHLRQFLHLSYHFVGEKLFTGARRPATLSQDKFQAILNPAVVSCHALSSADIATGKSRSGLRQSSSSTMPVRSMKSKASRLSCQQCHHSHSLTYIENRRMSGTAA